MHDTSKDLVHTFPSTHEESSLIFLLILVFSQFVKIKSNAHPINISLFIITIPWAAWPSKMATKMGFTITTPKFFNAPFQKPFISSSSSPCSTRAHQSIHLFRRDHLPISKRFILLSTKATTDQPGLSLFFFSFLEFWMLYEFMEVLRNYFVLIFIRCNMTCCLPYLSETECLC